MKNKTVVPGIKAVALRQRSRVAAKDARLLGFGLLLTLFIGGYAFEVNAQDQGGVSPNYSEQFRNDAPNDALLPSRDNVQRNTDFIDNFQRVEKNIRAGKMYEANQAFNRIAAYRRKNGLEPYEEAHYQLLFYWLGGALEIESQEKAGLLALVKDGAGHIESELYAAAAMTLLKKQIQDQAYAEALETVGYMSAEKKAKADLASIQHVVDKIEAVVASDKAVISQGKLGETGRWERRLIRSSFYLDSVKGQISDYDIACTERAINVPYDPDGSITLPDSLGKCTVIVKGSPEASFELVQLNADAQ